MNQIPGKAQRAAARGGAKALAAACALTLCADAVSAQLVSGRVIDDGSGLPLDLVTVELVDEQGQRRAGTVTDSAGAFNVRPPIPDSYRIRLTRLGYAAVETGPVSVVLGERVELELRMSAVAVPLAPLTVVSRATYTPGRLREYYERAEYSRRTGRGRIYMRDDLERMRLPQPSSILTQVTTRGGCRPTILLDGIPVSSQRELDSVVFTDALEGVEIYSGAAQLPQEFARRGYCAVALFWTRHDVEHARPLTWSRALLAAGIVIGGFLLLR